MGKSALAYGITLQVALERPAILFTTEMGELDVSVRLLAMLAKVESHRLAKADLRGDDWPRVADAAKSLAGRQVLIDSTVDLSLRVIEGKVRRFQRECGPLGIVVVDFFEELRDCDTSWPQADARAAIRRLKALARDVDAPVVVVSQIGAEAEQRYDKRPRLADLDPVAAVDEFADVVLFLYRDEYYDAESASLGLAEISVAKNRRGPTDSVQVAFLRRYAKFADLAA